MENMSSKVSTCSTNKTAKEKRLAKDVRNIVRQKPKGLLKLNKRLLKLKRGEELRAIPEAAAARDLIIDRNIDEEEPLTTKWSALQRMDINKKRSRSIDSKKSENKRQKRDSYDSDDQESDDSGAEYDSSSDEDEDNGHVIDEEVDPEEILTKLSNTNIESGTIKGSGKEAAWFDGVDPMLVEDDILVEVDMDKEEEALNPKPKLAPKITDDMLKTAVALDCEMVGCGDNGSENTLARISIVDRLGNCLYDKYVQPPCRITDYRTKYSGIRPKDLINAMPFKEVQREVAVLIKNKLLVAHAVKNDLDVLMLSHPHHMIRDTSTYDEFRKKYRGMVPSLKNLSRDYLNVAIQKGEHDSVEDARATMKVYMMHHQKWEESLAGMSRTSQRKYSKVNEKRRKRWNKKKTHNKTYKTQRFRK